MVHPRTTVCLLVGSHLPFAPSHSLSWFREALTCAGGWLTLQRQCLKALLIHLQLQVGQVLFHFPSHLGIFVQLFGVEEGTTAYPLFMPACLSNIQHCGIRAALTQRPGRWKPRMQLWSTVLAGLPDLCKDYAWKITCPFLVSKLLRDNVEKEIT